MDVGGQLRAAREAHGLTLARLSQRTRVPERALAAIERNDATALPPHPFGRGFVRTYAAEVALDPDRLVREYFAQFPAPTADPLPPLRADLSDASWQPQSQWMGMATALTILAFVVAAAVFGRRGETPSEPQPVGTAGETQAAPAPGASPPRVEPPGPSVPAAAPTPQAQAPITIVLSVSRPCWVAATVDGRLTIYRILQAGERETLSGEKDIALRFGDAGAVTWSINGRDPGAPGADGAVRSVRVTPDNAGGIK